MLTPENYKERIIDKKIEEYMNGFGAIGVEGSKWCGKTWTSLNHAKSVCYIAAPVKFSKPNHGAVKSRTSVKGGTYTID